MAGIRAIEGPLIVLAGGSSKDADFSPLGQLLSDRAETVICFGQTREALSKAIGAPAKTEVVQNLEQAVALASSKAQRGYTVLLSPACASFDQFRSYGHRGETFIALVKELAAP